MSAQNGSARNLDLFTDPTTPNTVDGEIEGVGEHEDPSADLEAQEPAKADRKPVSKVRRKKVERTFPAAPFQEALEIPLAIQKYGAGQRIRRIRLFDYLGRSPDSGTSRQLVTNSNRYGLTEGSYSAEWLELTPEGKIATSDAVTEREKLRVWFKLAIEQIPPFNALYQQFKEGRLPAKGAMVDFLRTTGVGENEVSECVDTLLLNAKFVGILRNVSGAERLVTIDYVLDYAPAGVQPAPARRADPEKISANPTLFEPTSPSSVTTSAGEPDDDRWSRVCFYICPIGSEGSEHRQHSDLFLGSIIEPALEQFKLEVVRADKIGEAGFITRQVIEHIMKARLVIADLSYHNPNVFYELALRHAAGKPVIQITRAADRIPFDVDQVRTIVIDDSSVYSLVPQLTIHQAAIANQVSRALESADWADNPVTAFYFAMMPDRSRSS